MPTIDQVLKPALQRKGWSSAEMARQLSNLGHSRTQQAVSSWLRGETTPRGKVLDVLVLILDVDELELRKAGRR